MRTRILLLAVVGVTFALAAVAPAHATTLFAVANDTGNQNIQGIFEFDSATPGSPKPFMPIHGLQQGDEIVGIDFRPSTGQLYGIGRSSTLYLVNPATGQATLMGPLSMTLSGTSFGVDFDPVPDRIRVVSDADQNLTIDPATGNTTADSPLMYMGGSPNPSIIGNAFTNSVAGATSTTHYALDAGNNYLVTINGGLITLVGPLGPALPPSAGFTIAPDGQAFFAAFTFFHVVNLTTGNAPSAGTFPPNFNVTGLAAAPAAGTPGGGTPGGGTPGGGTPGGDFDLNGVVDAADLVVFRAGLNASRDDVSVPLQAPDGLGATDRLDFEQWRVNFGQPAGGGSAGASQRRRAVVLVKARRRVTLGAGDRKRVKLPLTRAGKRFIRGYKKRRLKVTLRFTVRHRPAAGAVTRRNFQRSATLRVQRKRR